MTLYKCRDCTHEEDYEYKPSECFVCGGSKFILLEEGKSEIMAIEKDLFSSYNFQSTITYYCDQIGWKIAEIDSNKAIIRFNMESGSTQTVFIIRYDTTLELSCPSGLKFDSFDYIPHQLSSYLLRENSKFKLGFWCIEEISGRQVFSIMHNAKISLMDVSYFMNIVNTLINKCDDFEQAAEQALRR